MSERMPHRHGYFWRWVFLLTGEFHIRMFRFYCPHCTHTMSLCPPFIEPHYPYAYEVQEAAVDLHEHGKSFDEVAEDETIIVAGPVHTKTVWRWYKRWMKRVHLYHDSIWKFLLHYHPTLTLPKHTSSNWRNLMNTWSIVRQRLKRIHLSGPTSSFTSCGGDRINSHKRCLSLSHLALLHNGT
jgi:hypothetical protein